MKMQESGEMYLETILILSKRLDEVHAIDIAGELEYSKPSVSRAVNLLKDNGYLDIDKNGVIKLTKSGKAIATEIYERHQVLREILISLGVDESVATEDACRIEHVISHESFVKIKKFFKERENNS